MSAPPPGVMITFTGGAAVTGIIPSLGGPAVTGLGFQLKGLGLRFSRMNPMFFNGLGFRF